MGVLKNIDGNELFIDCKCGCGDSMRFVIDKYDDDEYAIMTKMENCKKDSIWWMIRKKFSKIWAIIRNKDYYYNDIFLTKEDYETFKNYINRF